MCNIFCLQLNQNHVCFIEFCWFNVLPVNHHKDNYSSWHDSVNIRWPVYDSDSFMTYGSFKAITYTGGDNSDNK